MRWRKDPNPRPQNPRQEGMQGASPAEKSDKIWASLEPFKRRLERARGVVARALAQSKRPAVAFSGGKDSLAVLELVCEQASGVRAVMYDSGLEYPETIPFVRATCERLGVELTIIEPGMSLLEIYKHCGQWGYRGPETEAVTYSWKDVARAMTAECARFAAANLGLDLLFLGLRADESLARRNYLAAAGEIHYHASDGLTHAYPIAWWTQQDVWAYLSSRGVPHHPAYDRTGMRSREQIRIAPYGGGTMLSAGRMAWLKAEYPELFNRFAAMFPEVRRYV